MGKTYITTEFHAHQTLGVKHTAWIRIRTSAFAYPVADNELNITLYQYLSEDKKLDIFEGSIVELMELVLLGKTYRDQLNAEVKTTCSS